MFSSDTRCLGGQKQVMDLMTSHYSALSRVKPTINTRQKSFVHVSKQKRPEGRRPMTASQRATIAGKDKWLDKLAAEFEYEETRQTFKRCNEIKSDIGYLTQNVDYKKKSKKLSQYRARNKNTFHEEEHMRNLAALRERVQNVGNAQDRNKNTYDPLTHPVRFFRRSEYEAKKVSLTDFQKKVDTNLAQVKKKNDELAKQWIMASVETGRQRPISTRPSIKH